MDNNYNPVGTGRRKINVAHFIGTLRIGGAENQVVLLANALDKEIFNSHVIVMHGDGVGFRDAIVPDIDIYSIEYRRRNALASLYRLWRYLRANRIDVLHCHMYHAITKGSLVGRLAGVPVVLTSEHGKNTWKRWRQHAVERYIVNRLVDKRVAVSEDIRNIRIRDDGVAPDDIIVLPNSVNTDVPPSENVARPRVVGTLGRMVDAKDFPVLVQAIGILRDQGQEVYLKFAGDGSERDRLEKLVDELNMNDRVEFLGMQPASSFLESIDIFAMSSKREGVPVALLEAMAHGLPIAATSVGGIPEVVTDGKEGLLCKSGDAVALSENIKRLMEDTDLRITLGNNARQKVTACYGIDSVASQWSDLYMQLLNGNWRN